MKNRAKVSEGKATNEKVLEGYKNPDEMVNVPYHRDFGFYFTSIPPMLP